MTRSALVSFLALAVGAAAMLFGDAGATGANSQTTSSQGASNTTGPPFPHPRHSQTTPTQGAPQTIVPPFPRVRGRGGKLTLGISGLDTGVARIAEGTRVFSLCWNGGAGPFEVSLTGPDGTRLIDATKIDESGILVATQPISFSKGRYQVDVRDSAGATASGAFQVVAASEIPGAAPQAPTSEAEAQAIAALGAPGVVFNYEAYLRIAPAAQTSEAPGFNAAAQLCNQGT